MRPVPARNPWPAPGFPGWPWGRKGQVSLWLLGHYFRAINSAFSSTRALTKEVIKDRVTANEIKRKGVACITESLAQAPEVAISVRGKNAYVGYGPVGSANRLVRTRMLGGVGLG